MLNRAKKGQRTFSVFSLTENTQRYKSLAGFAIFPSGAIFAFGKRYAPSDVRDLYHIAWKRSDNISHEQGEYIAFIFREHISRK